MGNVRALVVPCYNTALTGALIGRLRLPPVQYWRTELNLRSATVQSAPEAPSAGPRRRRLWMLIALIGIMLAGATLMAVGLRGAYLTTVGVRALAAATGGEAAPQLATAVAALEQASQQRPTDPHLQLLLARAYQQQGQHAAALAASEQAFRLNPADPQIAHELALAYEAGGAVERADAIWQAGGFSSQFMAGIGDRWYADRSFGTAADWYQRAIRRYAVAPFDLLFRATVAATIANDPAAPALRRQLAEREPTFQVFSLADAPVTIPAAALRWKTPHPDFDLAPGAALNATAPEMSLAYFWWAGEALLFVDVPAGGAYSLTIRAQDNPPPPIEFELLLNGAPVQRMALEQGDGAWRDLVVPLVLERGVQTLHINYLNDDTGGGADRNLIIEQLIFARGDS